MGTVVDFKTKRLEALNYDDAILREPTCDEIADEFISKYSISADSITLTVTEEEYQSRVLNLQVDLLNAWEELLITTHADFITDLKAKMARIEQQYSSDGAA